MRRTLLTIVLTIFLIAGCAAPSGNPTAPLPAASPTSLFLVTVPAECHSHSDPFPTFC